MASWISLLLFLLYQSTSQAKENDNVPFPYFLSETSINNVVQDPQTGRIYLGAINMIFQLRPSLHLEARAETGPKEDARTCTPPASACQDTKPMPNLNKLLLIHPSNSSLIVCGSRYRGICSLLNLSNVEQQLYYSDSKGERTYVTSIEDNVNVVGVMSTYRKDARTFDVFLVGKGYGSLDSTKLISTRILQDYNEWVVFESIIEASTVQTTPFVPKYLHDFQHAFKDSGFVYFLFSRTLDGTDNKNLTYVSRLCEDDQHYYSHTELQLNCGQKNKYNKVRAAFVASPGKELALAMTEAGTYGKVNSWNKVLFMVASSDDDENKSALCMYPLNSINERLVDIISACYSDSGKISGFPAVDIPYSFKTDFCSSKIAKDMLKNYKCGADFLPSPLASKPRYALEATEVWSTSSLLTAVAVAVENDHTIAFLGNNQGDVFKIHLTLTPPPYMYSKAPGGTFGEKVNKNLFFDLGLSHLYITTDKKITKVPVQTCLQKKDCQSCVGLRDPYCGWCVLEGRCTRKQDCSRSEENNTWLWSPNQACVQIEAFRPANLSCRKTQQVEITIPSLPRLRRDDKLQCVFSSFETEAVTLNNDPVKVVCSLPSPEQIPRTPAQQDYVSVPVRVLVNETIEVTSGEYRFYNCAATVMKNQNTPCISCVTSQWGCQWNAQDHSCSDESDAVSGDHVIKPQQPESCPQFESPNPPLIPVGHQIPISFQGKNLDIYKDSTFSIGTERMERVELEVVKEEASKFKFPGFRFEYNQQQEVNVSFHIKERETQRKIDSTLTVVLYDCMTGREDCSLCKHADAKYDCVWCSSSGKCVYRELCKGQEEPALCPDPQITEIIPRYGPLRGGIPVTIKGTNMGITKEDIKRITVAGVECAHLEDRYSVSTSVVCEIGPKRTPPTDLPLGNTDGQVEIELKGGGKGTSKVLFTYRDPRATSVHPSKGPSAGGTVITIQGDFLDTATKDDIRVSVGTVPCEVLSFGEGITCRTGRYQGSKFPSEPLTVTVWYGKNTSTNVSAAFQYFDNPKIADYKPKSSFFCGGRRIVVFGSGFELIQSAMMKVISSSDEDSVKATSQEFVETAFNKNDTVLEFDSPPVSDGESFRTFLQLDNMMEELKGFDYLSNPHFDNFSHTVITDSSIIIVTGRGFSKAMSAKEAEVFVGDASCQVNTLQDDKLILYAPASKPSARSKRHRRDATDDLLELMVKFGHGRWVVGLVSYPKKDDIPLLIIIPAVILPMLLFIMISIYCYRRKSRQAEREYEKVKHQLESLEESVRDRCKKEFTDLMIEMEDHTSDLSEGRIPFLDYKNYLDRNFFLPSKEGNDDPIITGKLLIPEVRRASTVQALNQFSNLLNSKAFLINFIRTLESRSDFNARSRGYFASLLTVALHGKLEYYTDIMRTLLLDLMDEHVQNKNPKLMLRRSETVVERMLCNWMSICLYQFLRDTAGEPLYKLFKALKHQVEKGPVDAKLKKAKYTLNDTGLLGDDVEYSVLTLQVLVHGEGPDATLVKVLNCDSITQVKEKIIDQVYRNLPYSQRPKVESVALEWRPGSTGQILSDLDLTSQKEGRWKRFNTLAHYNVRDNATLILSKVLHTHPFHQHQDLHDEQNALLEDDNTFHLVRPTDEIDEGKSKRGSMKDKAMTKAITEIYLTRLLSVKGTLQQFVDDFFRSVLCSSSIVPPAVKYFFDFLDEQAQRHDNVDEETLHIWKTNSLPLRFWVNILRNPHFIFDVHVTEVVDASLHVIAQTFMDACTKTEHKLSRESPSNKLLYAKEISTYKKMVDDYYSGIRQMVPVSDQDMNTHLAEVSRQHTEKLNTQVALHHLYQYASKYYDAIIQSLDEDPAAKNKQLTLRLQQVAAALENKTTDL
uniref:Plexin B2 n=3 Tax=Nothobranchius TaxID=28779 RepID=A0A1A8U212_NOTFU